MPADENSLQIDPATPADVPAILQMIKMLAEFERLSHTVVITEAMLHEQLFGPKPAAEVLMARLAGQPIGFALYFTTFSTFLGRPGLWLEDLFVHTAFRRRGVGRSLLRAAAHIARQRNCGRLEWSVLEWNEPALQLYRKLGATVLDDWRICRVSGEALQNL